ncbi:MAG: aminotransferase class V-fold PLP-dependent enzyme, partial [Lachnospiraceae bacterium]|nr:aminotransferase class V-fold PLP-dependent enzyme [Lachnospiraceae bacterium]
MIYLDNSATTYPKPQIVRKGVSDATANFGANPGRSGHAMALRASEEIYNARRKIADFFNEENPENVIFTLNCTHAVNIVLKGFLKSGDHVVVSDLEHNAVMRPLNTLQDIGVDYTVAKVSNDPEKTLNNFRDALRPNTRLVVCIHVSNVWGIKLPVERITAMCHMYDIPVLVDASQSAGTHKLDIKENQYDFLCMPGHKGLYGPMGTGVLITSHHDRLKTFIEGGT